MDTHTEIPYPYAPHYFMVIGHGLLLSSVITFWSNPQSYDWCPLFNYSMLSYFVAVAFQLANMENMHMNHYE